MEPNSVDMYSSLRSNVSNLGQILGETMKAHLGQEFLDKVEQIRVLAKQSRQGDDNAKKQVLELLTDLPDEELIPFAKAFNQFLNLANMAEQFHSISRDCDEKVCAPDPMEQVFHKIKNQVTDAKSDFIDCLKQMEIDLVLTAHPTEISRRTLIQKYAAVVDCLAEQENPKLSEIEQRKVTLRLRELIAQIWHTNEIRSQRPTPIDEAQWGLTTIETSLWQAMPEFFRQLNDQLEHHFGEQLPIDIAPIRFSSWMGGDRDGNPFVTAKVTKEVLVRNRKAAAELYIEDINELVGELSMEQANQELQDYVEGKPEPYRCVLRNLRSKLEETIGYLDARLEGHQPDLDKHTLIWQVDDLRKPLMMLYNSLCENSMRIVANGKLLDILRRIACFGVNMLKLDIRQDSARHTQVVEEIVSYLNLGDYQSWTEEEKQAFLLQELQSKRPLIPSNWQPSADVQEVIDTTRLVAQQPKEALGSYVISMASNPSDVLSVLLLLKESCCPHQMRIVPLFETLDDLNGAADCIGRLLAIDWYKGYTQGLQEVMIGYSDSAKDAGAMAAAWAQYQAQEELVDVCEKAEVKLTLFHGRGGSIGRGGGPSHQAILSQPPGSVDGRIRVTEQGEMIRFKFGLPKQACKSLGLYTSAVIEATLLPPPAPKPSWRAAMDKLSKVSVKTYRDFVRGEPDFVKYFRSATPEVELGKLPLGSRPAKRRVDGGIESLRAIPWIFAWSQNRLMLPAWLGAGEALRKLVDDGDLPILKEMQWEWPFFTTRLSMLEMVYAKAEPDISKYYETYLVDKSLHHLGDKLRERLYNGRDTLLEISGSDMLMSMTPWSRESINLRNPYIDPLHFLQVEMLSRTRKNEHSSVDLELALMLSIAGVAAGMRNTG
ncbi:phosphoenolpyruvate carboxylase [Shewanella sp. OPT22]|nr:phosphoenolpyruvate carboxylase [Shewanella sp. OPT22]